MVKKLLVVSLLIVLLMITGGCAGQEKILTVSGTVEAQEVNIGSEVSGKVEAVKVEEGQKVKEGDLLVELDDTALVLRHQQAEAALAALKAQYQELKSGSREQQLTQSSAQVAQAAAAVEAARDALKTAETELERIRRLYQQGAVSEQALNQTQLAYKQAESSYLEAVSRKQIAEAQLSLVKEGATREALDSMAAQVNQAEAALKAAALEWDKAKITAPKDGTVLTVNIREGELARPGVPLVTLTRLDTLYVETYIPEPWLSKVVLGQKVTIGVDGYQEKLVGTLTHIAAEAEFTPQNLQTREKRVDTVYAAKVKVEQGREVLKPGMPVDVFISPGEPAKGGSI